MFQAARDLDLEMEPRLARLMIAELRMNEFDRDISIQRGVARHVHFAQSAASQQALNLKTGRSDHGRARGPSLDPRIEIRLLASGRLVSRPALGLLLQWLVGFRRARLWLSHIQAEFGTPDRPRRFASSLPRNRPPPVHLPAPD
jgi:hypothetical protein